MIAAHMTHLNATSSQKKCFRPAVNDMRALELELGSEGHAIRSPPRTSAAQPIRVNEAASARMDNL